MTLKGFRLFWVGYSSVLESLYNIHKVLGYFQNWTVVPPICLSLIFFFQISQPVSWSSFAHVLLASNSLLVQVLQIEHPVVTPQNFISHPSYSPIEHLVRRPVKVPFLLPSSLLRGYFSEALHLDLISVTASLWPNSAIIQPDYGFIKVCHNN